MAQVIGGETQLLVKQAAGGDQEAVGLLLERLRPRLVLWCGSRMSSRLRAKVQPEDVAQEVLIALHKALPGFEVKESREAFLGWVFTIAENRIRDFVDYHEALKRKTIPPRSFSQTSPSIAAARTEAAGRLLVAMDSLSSDYRQVIQLRRLEEREFDQIADVMGRSRGAAHTLYWRAMEALREIVQKDENMPTDMSL